MLQIKADTTQNNERRITNIALSLILNVIFLLGILCTFEPTIKSDDYDMMNVLYGAMSGNTNVHILYINVLIGYLLKFVLYVFPNSSCYFVLMYFLIFISLSTISYVLFSTNNKKHASIFNYVFLIFVSYEYYIRLTFTKVAGILIIAGLVFALYEINRNGKLVKYLYSIFLIILGILVRGAMILPLLVIFFSTFLFLLVKSIHQKDSLVIKKVVTFIGITVCVLGIYVLAGKIESVAYNSQEEWAEYVEYNKARGLLLDYDIPDYETFKDEYEKLGVSQNDYNLWFNRGNIADPTLDIELLENIRAIYTAKEESLLLRIKSAFLNLPTSLQSNKQFYLVIICFLLLIVMGKKINRWIIPLVAGCWLFTYVYMYCRGRILYYIEAVFATAVAVILLYYCSSNIKINIKKFIILLLPISCILIYTAKYFYYDILSESFYDDGAGVIESAEAVANSNYTRLSLMSEDEKHLYLVGAYETNASYAAYRASENIEAGFYHNIFRLNMYSIPEFRAALDNYGVYNPFAEMVDDSRIYLYTTAACFYDTEMILQYVKENYNVETECTMVKSLEDMYIYRFHTGNLDLDVSKAIKNSKKVEWDIHTDIVEENLNISGYAYIDGEDSYSQNVYVELENVKTGESKFYYTLQEENLDLSTMNKYHGKYSSFRVDIPFADMQMKDYRINLILETVNGNYLLEANENK